LEVSTATIDLGAELASASIGLTNTGDEPVDWAIPGDAAPFIWSTTGGTLQPGESFELQLGIDRNGLPEGDVARQFALVSSAEGGRQVTAMASIEHPPTVTVVRTTSSLQCPNPAGVVAVTVTDESAITGAVLSWSGPGAAGSTAMTSGGGGWSGRLTPQAVNGAWTWVVTATDARGNTGTATAPFVVVGC
jgi:hypothetical protein